MKHQLTEQVKILQKAVLVHAGECLIVQRNPDSFSRPLKWDLPGGNSEWPEGITENQENLHLLDIAREIAEETGVVVDPDDFSRENLLDLRTFFEAERGVYSIIAGWIVMLDDDFDRSSIVLSSEHVAQAWIRPSDLPTYDFDAVKGEFIITLVSLAFQHLAANLENITYYE